MSAQHSYHTHPRKPRILTPPEVKAHQPFTGICAEDTEGALDRAKQRMQVAGVWSENQVLGQGYPIGCVAVEITQRCNLDCTLCYLSEMSESTKDIPLEEIFRRIESIKHHYGPGTDVQITGGDPTLRKRSELVEIVRRVKQIGMRPTLMTNGIAATRDLLTELCGAGLQDVAFHVDLTEERKGYRTETELNRLRLQYIDRARGLPLHVIFNTTVFEGNIDEIPELIRFFRDNADVVGMASFQLQADTGRGKLRQRANEVSLESVVSLIQDGAGTKISFDTIRIGHPSCHRYGLTLAVNGKLYEFWDEPDFFNAVINKSSTLKFDRARPIPSVWKVIKWAWTTPGVLGPGFRFACRKLWSMRTDLFRAKGRVRKLSFFVQNFMDASSLEADRIHACSFMVMTAQGPISMCMHNAKRDDYILQPVKVGGLSPAVWNPLTGKTETTTDHNY